MLEMLDQALIRRRNPSSAYGRQPHHQGISSFDCPSFAISSERCSRAGVRWILRGW